MLAVMPVKSVLRSYGGLQFSFDLGHVWYYYFIPETISNGGVPVQEY